MKKIFCFILTLVLLFNNIYCIYASDISTQALIDVDTDKLKNLSAEDLEPASLKFLELIGVGMNPAGAVLGKELNDAILEILGKDGAMKKDDDGNIYVMQNTVNEINTKVQDSVHALDGYYLFEPAKSLSFQNVFGDVEFRSDEVLSLVREMITEGGTIWTDFNAGKNSHIVRLLDDFPLYLSDSSSYIYSWDSVNSPSGSSGWVGFGGDYLVFNNTRSEQPSMWGGISRACYGTKVTFSAFKNCLYMFYGNPFKVFYSFQCSAVSIFEVGPFAQYTVCRSGESFFFHQVICLAVIHFCAVWTVLPVEYSCHISPAVGNSQITIAFYVIYQCLP